MLNNLVRHQSGARIPSAATTARLARVQPLSIYALMVGTLQLSRALADRQLADVVLEQGIQSALTLLGTEDRQQETGQEPQTR